MKGERKVWEVREESLRLLDLPLEVSWAFLPVTEQRPWGLAVRGGIELPTGDEDRGFGSGEVDVTVRHRDASIRLDVEGNDRVLDGTIYLNGDVFATVSGPEDEPTLLSASGDPLTLGEMLVLRQIFDTIEDVFDFLEDLLDPVDEIVVLGIVL